MLTVVPVNEANSRTAPVAVPLVISIVYIFPTVSEELRVALASVRVKLSPLIAEIAPEALEGVRTLKPKVLNMEGFKTWVVYPLGFEEAVWAWEKPEAASAAARVKGISVFITDGI